MKKSDVETHTDRPYGPAYPAVNVKVYGFPHDGEITEEDLNCDEKTCEKALEFAFEIACETFWEDLEESARIILEIDVNVSRVGRCGGWVIVQGLPPIEQWDAIALGKWSRFENYCKKTVKDLTQHGVVLDNILANEWNKEGAEQYNFIATEQGSKCIADMKKEAIEAGFGPVVR
jgi:hypothetical protein